MRNILLVISGPSGVGKGTMVERLTRDGDLAFSVSCTTRAPRAGEVEGKHYFFLTKEEFEARIRADDFLEYDNHFGHYYGTPRSFVVEELKERSVVLDVDVVGALNVKKRFPEAVLVMLLPPDISALKARLQGRESETPEEQVVRLGRAMYELGQKDQFDYTVLNDEIERAAAELRTIVEKEKNRA